MPGQSIPSTSPDVEAWLIATFGSTFAGAAVRNIKPKSTKPDGTPNPAGVPPYAQVIIRADLQNRVTPISRFCRLGVQGWSVRADGTADLSAARQLAADYSAAIERAPRAGILLDAEVDAGPYRVIDSTSGVEYQYVTLLLELAV